MPPPNAATLRQRLRATNLNTAFLDGVDAESFTEAEDMH
jgi:hypothetical protein